MSYLELYLDPPPISSFIRYGEKNFPESLTPGTNVFFKRWAVSRYFQDITGIHSWRLHR